MYWVLGVSVVALIIWDLSWHLPNDSVYRSYFVFDVNEVQKAAWTEFLCERVIVNYMSHSLWTWNLFSIMACRSELPIMNFINMTLKKRVLTLKNLMREKGLNDIKFNIKKSLDTLIKKDDSFVCKYMWMEEAKTIGTKPLQ